MDLKRREELKDALIEKFKAIPWRMHQITREERSCRCLHMLLLCVVLASTHSHVPDTLRARLRPEGCGRDVGFFGG